jgi:hypothetical protein
VSASLETWIGAGALVGNMILTVATGRKTVRESKVVAETTATNAAEAVKVVAQEQVQTIRETARAAAGDGAISALNGTAAKVGEIKTLLTNHITATTARFDQQDKAISSIAKFGRANSKAIDALKRKPR